MGLQTRQIIHANWFTLILYYIFTQFSELNNAAIISIFFFAINNHFQWFDTFDTSFIYQFYCMQNHAFHIYGLTEPVTLKIIKKKHYWCSLQCFYMIKKILAAEGYRGCQMIIFCPDFLQYQKMWTISGSKSRPCNLLRLLCHSIRLQWSFFLKSTLLSDDTDYRYQSQNVVQCNVIWRYPTEQQNYNNLFLLRNIGLGASSPYYLT